MLVLNITSACNFQCKTCLREHPDDVSHFPLDLLRKTLQEAKGLRLGRLVFITGGEPCLHPEFKEIVKTIVGQGFSFGLVSNGSLCERYKFLVDEYKDKISFMSFSLDGSTKEIHDQIRQEGSFDKLKETIQYFSAAGVYIRVGMCVNKINMHQIESVAQLASELGVRDVVYMNTIKTSLNNSIVLSGEDKKKCLLMVQEVRDKNKIKARALSSFGTQGGVEFCNALNLESIAVNPKGEISFCCDTIGYGATVGSLKDYSFYELYSKCLDLSCSLKKKRVEMFSSGKLMEGFDSCEFCNTFLSGYMARPIK